MKAQFTKLYKSNRKSIPPSRKTEFLRELQKVIDSKSLKFSDNERLQYCFIWEDSMQGSKYWVHWDILLFPVPY